MTNTCLLEKAVADRLPVEMVRWSKQPVLRVGGALASEPPTRDGGGGTDQRFVSPAPLL